MSTILNALQNPAIVAGISAFVIALIDLAMAINPNLKANGVLHMIVVFFQKEESQNQPPQSA